MPTPPKRPITTTTASYTDDPRESSSSGSATSHELLPTTSHTPLNDAYHAPHPIQYRVYKRRFLGLLELIALNIAISWCWLTYAPVSTTSAQFFDVSVSAVNWLSTTFLFAFAVATPATIYVLNKYGPKAAIVVAATLTLVGSWVRYAGVRGSVSGEGKFGVVMFGQILVGFAQPFVLSAPTRYSDVWFSEKGRIAATAVASLANPFGGALGQLINPFWCKEVDDVGKMTLYVALIVRVRLGRGPMGENWLIVGIVYSHRPPGAVHPRSTPHAADADIVSQHARLHTRHAATAGAKPVIPYPRHSIRPLDHMLQRHILRAELNPLPLQPHRRPSGYYRRHPHRCWSRGGRDRKPGAGQIHDAEQ